MKEEWDCLGEGESFGKAVLNAFSGDQSNAAWLPKMTGRIVTHWEVWWWTALSAGHPFKRSGKQSLRGQHTWATQTRWDESLHQLLPGLSELDYWSRPGDRVIGQLPAICTAVGGEGLFYGPVTPRQICDITIMHCHGGLSLKAKCIEFQLCSLFFFLEKV